MTEKLPQSAEELAKHYETMRRERRRRKENAQARGARRARLTSAQRRRILAKTGGRCHLCGGRIDGKWQADHVLAHSGGGQHSEDNYLPAHALCNNYRWHYTAEEFQQILKLGVWARTQIQRLTRVGRYVAEEFLKYEKRRAARNSKFL
jgi:5-methylcytosine-specific restriction endonuclease McrA